MAESVRYASDFSNDIIYVGHVKRLKMPFLCQIELYTVLKLIFAYFKPGVTPYYLLGV